MSLKGQLGNAVMRRIEAMPSVKAAAERAERLAPTRQAAMSVACSIEDDESARESLRGRLTAPAEVLREAAIDLSRHRDDYVGDRAYRLLSAAAAHAPVQPMPPERADLFERERALGNMPMRDAYQQLASIEPRLHRIEQTVRAGAHRPAADGDTALGKKVEEQLRELVGGSGACEDELMRTTLASSLTRQYLWILSGAPQFGSPDTGFYEAPMKMFVATGVLERGRSDQR